MGYGIALFLRSSIVYDAIVLELPPVILINIEHYRHFMARLPLAFGHIGLVILLCRFAKLSWIHRALSAAGQLSLSNYLIQTVISIFLFYGFGFALFAELERFQIALVIIGIGLLQVFFSLLWLRYFRYGPIEWIWRSLVHGNPVRNLLTTGQAIGVSERVG
jgi:uncharacterized protein